MADGLFGRRIRPEDSIAQMRANPPGADGEAAAPDSQTVETKQRFQPREPMATFERLVVAEDTLREVKTAVARIDHHDLLYRVWGLEEVDPKGRGVAINLYGPPGTGKTLCAEAIADRLGKPILEVSYAEIESKYVGETPKNIVEAFRRARETQAVLFFDEADSILGRRMTNVTQAADHSVNVSRAVMLKQLDAFAGVVLFATNLARNFDDAFVRRILAHVEMPLPDESTRARLWELLVPQRLPGRGKLDLAGLAKTSEGLAGGDIRNAIVLAAASAVQRSDPDRWVTQADLESAVRSVVRAKSNVGGSPVQPRRTVTVEEVSIDEVPEDTSPPALVTAKKGQRAS